MSVIASLFAGLMALAPGFAEAGENGGKGVQHQVTPVGGSVVAERTVELPGGESVTELACAFCTGRT